MALRVLLVRHAETTWNRERRYQGWTDTALSETGRAQAEAAGRLLAREPLAAVWSSPLRRAHETAAAIAGPQGLPVRVSQAFKEMGFGDWEGLTVAEVSARFAEEHRAWIETPHLAVRPGGEALEDVRRRVLAGLDALRLAHDGQSICLVAHGVPSRLLILAALGLGPDRLWSVQVSPSGISELEFRDDWTAVHRMNTLVHLDALPVPR